MQHKRQSKGDMEMHTIHSLTSGISKQQIRSVSMQTPLQGEYVIMLTNISCVYDARSLCDWLILAVHIATA